MFHLAEEVDEFHNLPNDFNSQSFKDFESTLTVLAGYPNELTFTDEKKVQPHQELKVINDYTNSFASRAASTCDSAIDKIVLKKEDCPASYNHLEGVTIENARMLIGQKVCIVLTDYTSEFWDARYVTDSFSCRRARGNVKEFIAFRNKIQDKNSGFAYVSMTLVAMEELLSNAKFAIVTRSTA